MEKEGSNSLVLLEGLISNLNKENNELEEKNKQIKKEYEFYLRNNENNHIELVEQNLKALEDLKEKNQFLNDEVKYYFKIKKVQLYQRCQQLNDPEFIFATLANCDFYLLNKFLVTINNHIHHGK